MKSLKASESAKRRWKETPPEIVASIRKKQSDSKRLWWESLSPEDRKQAIEKMTLARRQNRLLRQQLES